MLEKQRILCTGAAGSIGSELVRQLIPKNEVIILDNNETGFFNLYEELRLKGFQIQGVVGDVRDRHVFQELSRRFGLPDIIFHCAALKHVTPSFWSRDEYVKTNVFGTFNVLAFAETRNIKLVNISTDKVTNANSIMGASKRLAEIAVRDAGFISVRFGNVMGSRGSVLEIWQRQIERGELLTVTDGKMTRYMMTIEEACRLVIRASEIGQSGSIMVMDMGEKVNILSLAKDILKKSGKETSIKMIGARFGETLTETLMTEDEKNRAVKQKNFWIIPP